MKLKRFTEEQIITILKEHEAGSTVGNAACDAALRPERTTGVPTAGIISYRHAL